MTLLLLYVYEKDNKKRKRLHEIDEFEFG